MENTVLTIAVIAAALGSGLIAGLLFVFSNTAMRAFGRLPAAQGIAAMQAINVAIINPLFLIAFMGTGLLGAGLALHALISWSSVPGAAWLIFGGLLYLVGGIGITAAFNVPLNNALAAVAPGTPEAAAVWNRYLRVWTHWNHLRTTLTLAASAAFMLALL